MRVTKFVAILVVVAGLIGCRNTPEPVALPSTSTRDTATPMAGAAGIPEHNSGCVGQPLDTCLENLRAFFRYSDQEVQRSLALSQRVDVNGKKIGRDTVSIFGVIQGADENSLVELDFDRSRIVTSIDINRLPRNPAFADTEEEYERTGLYKALEMVFGDSCSTLTPQATYRFFQNQIKPKIIHEPEKTEWTATGVSRTSFDKALGVPFCGRSLSFTSLQGYDTEDITLDNPHGVLVFSGISVK